MRPPTNPIQVVDLPWGCSLEIDTRETIGRSVWTAGVHDLAVVEVLFRLADPKRLAIDVGANIGAITGALAARAGEVWAFEPHPTVFQRLASNVERFTGNRGFANCRLFQAALTEIDGELCLETTEGFENNQGTARVTSGPGTRVRAFRLDALLAQQVVGVLKVDVEGHELCVLRGAESSLIEGRIRHIVFEDHVGPGSPVCRFLAGHGYTLFEIGWRLKGPILGQLGSGVRRVYEAPSYLATREPDGAFSRCSTRGWECFRAPGRD